MSDPFYEARHAFGRFDVRHLSPMAMDAPHRHGHIEVNVLSGAVMHYRMDGRDITVEDGQMVIFWAGRPHRTMSVEPTGRDRPALINLYLPLDWFLMLPRIDRLKADLMGGAVLDLRADLTDRALVARWFADRVCAVPALEALTRSEIAQWLRRKELTGVKALIAANGSAGDAGSAHERHHAVAMIRHVIENIGADLSSREIAAATGLSTNHALTVFSRTLGVSLRQFIIRLRLQMAHAMLVETDRAASDIAAECGFSSISLFYDHFRRHFGTTPKEARTASAIAQPAPTA